MAYEDYGTQSSLSITSDGPQLTRTIRIRADTELEVQADPLCPVYGSLIIVGLVPTYCQSIQITAIGGAAADTSSRFLWEVIATWKPLSRSNPAVNKASWNISFRPQSYLFKNVKTAADQTHNPSSNPNWPAVTTGINQTEEGIQGVEVDEMVEVLTMNFFKAPSAVEAYLTSVRAIAGLVNSDAFTGPWGTYEIGEARVTGIGVQSTNGEVSTVTIEVSRSKNVASLPVYIDYTESEVTVAKKGWEYLWLRYIKGTRDGDTDVRPMSVDAHVAKVYDTASFAALGVSSGIWT